MGISSSSRITFSRFMIIFGLSVNSGIPFLLSLSTLGFWFSELGFSAETIGFFTLTNIPYTLKFLWAPIVEKVNIPAVSKAVSPRKMWAYLSLCCASVSMIGIGMSMPCIPATIVWSLLLSFSASTYDIVLDTLRIELLSSPLMGFGAAVESTGFRFGMLISGAGALYLAHAVGWSIAYCIMAIFPLFSIVMLFFLDKQTLYENNAARDVEGYSSSFYSILKIKNFSYIVLMVLGLKAVDAILNSMAAPFLCDLGFSKLEFAHITKVFGISLMILGGFCGGGLIHKFTLGKSVLLSLFLQGVSGFLFLIQGFLGHDVIFLTLTMAVESFCSGLTGTVFIAYISSFCKVPFTATHFTLLYSLGSLGRILVSSLSGWIAVKVGWQVLFLMTAIFPFFVILLFIRSPLRQSS